MDSEAMPILIVTYDLKVSRDYTPFFNAIQQQGAWCHYLASTWLIDTNRTPQQVADAIQGFLSPGDFLLVMDMGPRFQGLLPKEAWDWINSHHGTNAMAPMPPFLSSPPPSLRK